MPVVEHLDHVRMPGQTERLGFAAEAVGRGHVVGGGGAEKLDGDGEAVGDPGRFVDDAARPRPHARADSIEARNDDAFELAPPRCSVSRRARLRSSALTRIRLRRGVDATKPLPPAKSPTAAPTIGVTMAATDEAIDGWIARTAPPISAPLTAPATIPGTGVGNRHVTSNSCSPSTRLRTVAAPRG